MSLQGATQLKARLKALNPAWERTGTKWAEETARRARIRAPRGKTGKLVSSIKPRKISAKKASVYAIWYGHIVDVGAKAHDIGTNRAVTHRKGTLKGKTTFTSKFLTWQGPGGQPIFAKKVHHPGSRATGFAAKAAHEALDKGHLLDDMVKAWNSAA